MADDFLKIGHLEDKDFDQKGNINVQSVGSGSKPIFFMVYGSYCGHCTKAKPAFAKVFKDHGQRKAFLAALQTDDPSSNALMKRLPGILLRHGIEFRGVPTYIMYNPSSKTYVEYTGSREAEAMRLYIQSM
jgi:thiol-disulfide isomerase/thioredoxin